MQNNDISSDSDEFCIRFWLRIVMSVASSALHQFHEFSTFTERVLAFVQTRMCTPRGHIGVCVYIIPHSVVHSKDFSLSLLTTTSKRTIFSSFAHRSTSAMSTGTTIDRPLAYDVGLVYVKVGEYIEKSTHTLATSDIRLNILIFSCFDESDGIRHARTMKAVGLTRPVWQTHFLFKGMRR